MDTEACAEDHATGSSPRVSVVMSVYNGVPYVCQAVDSILSQTFHDFEFVIVDDGSTDETPQVLALYDDPRIVILQNERNLGLAASLNRGLATARGEYIARQDADDISNPERLSKQVAFLGAHPEVGVVATTTEWIDGADKVLRIWYQPTDNGAIQATLLKYCCLIHGSTMYRRRCIEEVGGYDPDMRTGQDYDLWLRMSEICDIVNLPDVLYRYRWHENMASLQHSGAQDRRADIGRSRAFSRRRAYARSILSLRGLPRPLAHLGRRRVAQRYVSWSAGARQRSRRVALYFLIVSLFLSPTMPEVREYVAGILMRKLHLLDHHTGGPGCAIP